MQINAPKWRTPADVAMWGDRLEEARNGENTTAPYGQVSLMTNHRAGQPLAQAQFVLSVRSAGGHAVGVQCSQFDLTLLAAQLLNAAYTWQPDAEHLDDERGVY